MCTKNVKQLKLKHAVPPRASTAKVAYKNLTMGHVDYIWVIESHAQVVATQSHATGFPSAYMNPNS